jgi:glycosyltransferase involved in cell wall biosynthesis
MVSVKYSGPWGEASGYAQANRNIIKALHDADVDVVTELQSYAKHPTDYGEQFELAKSLQNKHNNSPIKILHITPNVYAKHKEVGKYHVGHLFWETTGMAKDWTWYLHEVREIWTGCEYNKKCFIDSGFEGKIFKFPQPINTDSTESPIAIDNARGYIFYSIFQWIERKNPKALLEAYWREFEHEKNVTLVIKTYGLSFQEHEEKKIFKEIEQLKTKLNLAYYPRTLIIKYLLSDKEIHQLHESGDCFVSAHRGEGWGVPQVEALVHKKPVISTNLGGCHEWVPDDCMYKVNYKMTNVQGMDWAEQYTKEQKWAEVDINDLRAKMRYVFDHPNEAQEFGLKGHEYVRDNLNFKKVGQLMRQRLEEIYQEQKL